MVEKKNLEKVVLLVNEIHHDMEDSYHSLNKLMHEFEEKTWINFLKDIDFKNKSILEIGTGSGFFPLFFLKRKINFSNFVCTDISENILFQAKTNIQKNFKKEINKFIFKKTNGKDLPFKKNQFDIILMNSVMHHLPNRNYFFKEAKKVLKKEGVLIVGHEPNRFFYKNYFLFSVYKSLSFSLSLLGKIKDFRKKDFKNLEIIKKINLELKKKDLIKKDLSLTQINSYIDFGANKGINYSKTNNLFKIEKELTTNYLLNLNFAYDFFLWRWFVNIYDFIFSKLFNNSGGTYFVKYKLK